MLTSRLVLPVRSGQSLFRSAVVVAPTAGTISASTDAIRKSRDPYLALMRWIEGTVREFLTEDGAAQSDDAQRRAVVRHLPYKAAEALVVDSLLQAGEDDGIEGVYPCPRCGTKVICEEILQDGQVLSDTRDHIGALERVYLESEDLTFARHLTHPVQLKSGQAVTMQVDSLTFRYLTLQDLSASWTRHGEGSKANLGALAESIVAAEDQPVDAKWRSSFGLAVVERLHATHDLMPILKQGGQYGIRTARARSCSSCGKEWEAEVSPLDFFASALRRMA